VFFDGRKLYKGMSHANVDEMTFILAKWTIELTNDGVIV
jgi:hypothetical protein